MMIRAASRRLFDDTRGVTLVLVAFALSALIGFTALGVETGFWYAIKRYNQSAADIGALSGAMEKAGGNSYSDICNLAKLAAQTNGFTFVSFTCPTSSPACTSPATGQMCANNPPVLGPNTTNATAVEVILAQQQSALFASLFVPNVTIDTRAVALTQVAAQQQLHVVGGVLGVDLHALHLAPEGAVGAHRPAQVHEEGIGPRSVGPRLQRRHHAPDAAS